MVQVYRRSALPRASNWMHVSLSISCAVSKRPFGWKYPPWASITACSYSGRKVTSQLLHNARHDAGERDQPPEMDHVLEVDEGLERLAHSVLDARLENEVFSRSVLRAAERFTGLKSHHLNRV